MMNSIVTREPALLDLTEKIDRLSTQVTFLTEEAQRQKQRQQEWDELKEDVQPLANEAYRLAVSHLQELDPEVQLEDLLRLLKRLLGNTRNFEQLLDQVEGLLALGPEVSPLSREVLLSLSQRLAELEQKGYFVFLQGGLDMLDRIVTSFSAEEVSQLGENIVLILQTVKEMTQPEIMTMLRQTAHIVADEEPVETSLRSLVRQFNDPAVRRGLAKTLQVLKSVADKPE
jgi:uncharacterized protein YjgD (DUF1641 family)